MRILERMHQPLMPRRAFLRRFLAYGAVSMAIIFASLAAGIVGYRYCEGMSWIDAFVNAAMIMGGMGPVGEIHTTGGKLFAGIYALYCGIILLVSIGILMAPVFHRFLHHFHLALDEDEGKKEKRNE